MSPSRTMKLIAGVALPAVMLGVLMACSTDSPTAPQQQAGPGPGGASAAWSIEVSITPRELTAASANPATVKIKVRRAADNTAPPQGTTVVVSTSLGEFNAVGSALTSIATSTVNGRAEVLLFPGGLLGTAIVQVQLENSVGRENVKILEAQPDLLASFDTVNTTGNLSIQFVNTSTGDPTSFAWNFGDGAVSSEENPVHVYARTGDYVVTLEIFRGSESSRFVAAVRAALNVFLTGIEPRFGTFGTVVVIEGQGFDSLPRVFFGGFLVDVISFSGNNIRVRIPEEAELSSAGGYDPLSFFDTEVCDDNEDAINGERPLATPQDVKVEISGSGGEDTLTGIFLWEPSSSTCIEDE